MPQRTHRALDCNASRRLLSAATLLSVLIGGCATTQPPQPQPKPAESAANCPAPPPPVTPAVPAPPAPAPLSMQNNLRRAQWSDVTAFNEDNLAEGFAAFVRSCFALKSKAEWQAVCTDAASLPPGDEAALRRFFTGSFTPYAVVNPDGTFDGTITGYYEPHLRGSRRQTPQYRYPVYGVPDDLITVDLSEVYPELKNMRLRGRIDGRRVVPYYSRTEIGNGKGVSGRELLWVEDPVDLFFLQIQGSGKVTLDTGETIRLAYADQNGHPYKSVGRLLVERGELTLDQASMQGIRAWGQRNPDKLGDLLNTNASYVFFREQAVDTASPAGALGVPLTPGRSLAVDPRVIPLGAPVFLSTTQPNSTQPLHRLMAAQDTGGAIKGAVRADLFWGSGDEAGALAGRMRQTGRLWVLLPNGSGSPGAAQ